MVDYRGGPRCSVWWITGLAQDVQHVRLQGSLQVFRVVDYRGALGFQCGGLAGSPQVFMEVDYKGPRCSAWLIAGEQQQKKTNKKQN